MPKGPSKYKGIPRKDWHLVRENSAVAVAELGQVATPEVPRETAPPIEQREEVIAALAETETVGAPDPLKPETIPPNLFSGNQKRLEWFGEREGFRRRWFNDERNGLNIGLALKSGWTFVERVDVQLNAAASPRNADLGSHVKTFVGSDANPMYAYLMEKPEWLCEIHENGPGSRGEEQRRREQQIAEGTIGSQPGDGRYSARNPPLGSPSGLPPITTRVTLGK